MITISVAAHTKEKTFDEIANVLPNIGQVWLLMDILAIAQGDGQVVGDQLCGTAYAQDGVLENYLRTLASYGYVQIVHSI